MTKIVEPGFTVTQTKFAGRLVSLGAIPPTKMAFYGISETITTDMTDGYKTIAGSSHSATQICQAGVECIDGKEINCESTSYQPSSGGMCRQCEPSYTCDEKSINDCQAGSYCSNNSAEQCSTGTRRNK